MTQVNFIYLHQTSHLPSAGCNSTPLCFDGEESKVVKKNLHTFKMLIPINDLMPWLSFLNDDEEDEVNGCWLLPNIL